LAIQARTARSGHQLFSSFRLCSKQDLNPVLVQEEKFVGADFDLTLEQGVTSTMEKWWWMIGRQHRLRTESGAVVWN
jgi:hypothetical protein